MTSSEIDPHAGRPRRLADPDMQGITRDNRPAKPSDAGWRVRLMKQGTYVADRHFRDLAYNGRSRARTAAKCYRDDMVKQHEIVLGAPCKGTLALERQGAGLTQKALADLLGVSAGLIAKWERSDQLPEPARAILTAVIARTVIPTTGQCGWRDIHRIRTEVLKWSQKELAAVLGCSYAAVGFWERGQRLAPGWVLVYLWAICQGWNRCVHVVGGPINE
ncbi:DNA-binding transcriptional regulator YiaG, contains XRE-type HTH domain [Pseudomonas abietaniphila]|uniref:DNA-binding transcriptional regulator YiaG, contains XRE-type HTH domain n=2 Tax=Pseudomonas abietaniphila TaxID=89065 RepID=A0A1G8QW21_9PSED|nr:DNA-binding transcriptional regulator YiaG, contains XRE-type HTH domain [Pseudomonas abietaniphila]